MPLLIQHPELAVPLGITRRDQRIVDPRGRVGCQLQEGVPQVVDEDVIEVGGEV
jgi:hypothetical protein